MCSFEILVSVDPSLGRLEYSLLSDQTLMEMLIEGFDDDTKKMYQDNHGMYLDVCEWSCVTCDDEQRATEISMLSNSVNGSLELRHLPPKVQFCNIFSFSSNRLTGEIDSAQLPRGMKSLTLINNQITGEIKLAQLPEGMKQLDLRSNQLTGGIDLTQMPEGMKQLSLQNNQLTGEIDLTQLPEGMSGLYLENNQLTGEVDLTQLPGGLYSLNLGDNQLSGEIDLTQLPDGMNSLLLYNNELSGSLVIKGLPANINTIDAGGNYFNAIAVVDSQSHAAIDLEESGVMSVVDENGRELDMQQFLY